MVWPKIHAVLGASALVATVLADTPVSTFCAPGNSVCAGLNLPSSGTDTFFQVKASTSGGWAGIGVGKQMAGSLIFIVYPDASGKNVTVSPRLGTGEFEPDYDSSLKVTLLSDSGISGDTMTANFKCSNCRTWDSGSIDTTSSSLGMIWSIGPGTKINSDDPGLTSLTQHQTMGTGTVDATKATGGDGSANPFASSSGSSGSGNLNGGSSSGSQPSIGAGSSFGSFDFEKIEMVLTAHAVVMAVVWVLLFPFGAAIIRLLNNRLPNPVAMHRGLQIANTLLAFVGLGLGVWVSDLRHERFIYFHQYFGVVITALLVVQAMLGALHHSYFVRHQKRSWWSYGHIWFGRIVIICAVVNGGIGLQPKLAHASSGQIAAYSVIAVAVFIVYITCYFLKKFRNRSMKERQPV